MIHFANSKNKIHDEDNRSAGYDFSVVPSSCFVWVNTQTWLDGEIC